VQGIAVRAANVTIENVTVTDIGTGSSVATPRGIFAGDEASHLRINDTVIRRVNGSQAEADQAHAIQVAPLPNTQVSDVRITNTTISNITDGRHVSAVTLNNNITGEVRNNTIRGLNTVNTTGIRGFTQAIQLAQGQNVPEAPRDVTIANNTIADLENTSRPNDVPATHILVDTNSTNIDIRDNRFEVADAIEQFITPATDADIISNALVETPYAHAELRVNELYVVDRSGAFDSGDNGNNTFSNTPTVVPDGETEVSVPRQIPGAVFDKTIQSAVDATAVGGTVVIPNGTYDETVTIDTEGVTLRGAQAGVDARGDRGPESRINNTSTTAPPIEIDASDVTIDGLAVESDHRSGIEIRNASVDDLRIANVAVTGVDSTSQDAHGILLNATDGTGETIENISISRSQVGGLEKADRYSTGITFLPKQNDLRNVTVTDVRVDGITGETEARGIAVHAQSTSADPVTDVRITNTTVANLRGQSVRGIGLFETDGDPRIGPTNVRIRNVTVTQTDATTTPTNETNISLFIGGYEALGAGHLIDGLDADGTVVRHNTDQSGFQIADAESLNLTDSTMRGLQVARTDGLHNLTITDELRVNRTQADALDPVLTRLDNALATVSVTRTDPAAPTSTTLTLDDTETIAVDLRTTAPLSGVTVDLANATAGGVTELRLANLTETVRGDGTARYTTTFRADTSGGPVRYHASITAIDGHTDTNGVFDSSRPLLVRPPAPAGPDQPVKVTPTSPVAEEVVVAPDSDTEVTVGGITSQLPDDPERSTSALRADIGDANADPIMALQVEAADPTSATFELRINNSSVTDVDALAATRFNGTGYEVLPTTVIDSTAERVDLEVETPGFSLFAVVETNVEAPAPTPAPAPPGGGGSGGGGGGGGVSSNATFLFGETAHTQTLDHSTLNKIAIDFAEPIDGLVRVAVVEAPDRPTIESSAATVGAVSITPPKESTETNATLALTLNATALEAREIDPTDIVVYRIDTAETVHEPVTASVTAETNDTVTVAAETPGFSTFVLATTQPEVDAESEAVQTESATETADESPAEEPLGDPESTTEDNSATTEASNVATPGFGPLIALVALVMLALAAVGRNWDHP